MFWNRRTDKRQNPQWQLGMWTHKLLRNKDHTIRETCCKPAAKDTCPSTKTSLSCRTQTKSSSMKTAIKAAGHLQPKNPGSSSSCLYPSRSPGWWFLVAPQVHKRFRFQRLSGLKDCETPHISSLLRYSSMTCLRLWKYPETLHWRFSENIRISSNSQLLYASWSGFCLKIENHSRSANKEAKPRTDSWMLHPKLYHVLICLMPSARKGAVSASAQMVSV